MHYEIAKFEEQLKKIATMQTKFESDINTSIERKEAHAKVGKPTIHFEIQINNNTERILLIDDFIEASLQVLKAMQKELVEQKQKLNEHKQRSRIASNHCRACDRWFN